MSELDFVSIKSLSNPSLAEIIKNVLEEAGIPCFLQNENQAGFSGVLGIDVLVPSEHADRAKALLEERLHEAEDLTDADFVEDE